MDRGPVCWFLMFLACFNVVLLFFTPDCNSWFWSPGALGVCFVQTIVFSPEEGHLCLISWRRKPQKRLKLPTDEHEYLATNVGTECV